MRYRIFYVDKYHEEKTLVYECDYYSEVLKFSDTLGNVIKIDPLDGAITPPDTRDGYDDDYA
jgi:hypothetical protein